MSSIPPELIYRVLENEYYTPAGTPNYKLLKRCMLVCRSWSGPAQALLFRSPPQLATRRSISVFYATLLSSATQELRAFSLGDCVRTLHLSIGRTRKRGCSPEMLVKLLQACPRVYELVLGFHGISDIEEDTLKNLKAAGQKLKALRLLSCSVSVAFDLFDIWPNIQFLKIGLKLNTVVYRADELSVLREYAADGGGGLVQRPTSGAKFCLYELVLCTATPDMVLNWLLASSADSLRILDLQGGIYHWIAHPFTSYPIVAPYAPRLLRSLRLCHDPGSLALLQMSTALEELVLRHLPTFSPTPYLPLTIEHLSFECKRKWATLQPFIIEAVDALPILKTLTYAMSEECLITDRSILNTMCGVKGVEVVLSDLPQVVVKEDPVMVNRFPRTRSVSNFAAMN